MGGVQKRTLGYTATKTSLLILLTSIMISLLTHGAERNANFYLSRWSQRSSSAKDQLQTRPIVSQPSLPTSRPELLSPNPLAKKPSVGRVGEASPVPLRTSSIGNGSITFGQDGGDNGTDNRDSRFFPLFSLVTIENTACTTKTGDNGTCYTASDCKTLGGSASGTCAQGFGTCCVFQMTCGGTASQNCTYFVNENFPKTTSTVGSCQLTVNKINNNICQLRIDFDTFMLSQPDSTDHQCLNDRFSVSGGTPTPVICGVNTGNHMYVALGPGATSPAVLTFVTMGPAFDRKWKIKVTQIPCNTDYTAPTNCLQWFQGVTGQIKSYNFDLTSGLQLANQDYSVCIRTEKNFCGIQYMACADTVNTDSQSFTITGSTSNPVGSVIGAANCRKDWLTIPCVSDSNQNPFSNCQDRLCGDNLNVVASTTAGNVIVYSYVKPFTLVYHTDSSEGSASPTELNNRGFCLDYVQQPCV